MKIVTWVIVVLAIVGAGVWQFAGEAAAPETLPVTTHDTAAAETATAASSAPVHTPMTSPAATNAGVERLIEEAHGPDATKRAQAIAALATAPRAQALPALHRIVTNGEPQVDRPAALNSLRELALGQGDQDGKVREAIREVLYHDDGSNPALAAAAQEALDVVEESEMK